MGCCVSSSNSKPSTRKGHHHAGEVTVVSKPPKHEAEEETVKQVLSSETPKWNNNNNNIINTSIITKAQPQNKECKIKKAAQAHEEKEETWQVSEEVCSLMSQSDSISMSTTTTISELIREEQAEAIQQTRKRVIRSPNKRQKNRSFSSTDVSAKTRQAKLLHASNNNNNASARLLHVQCRDIPPRSQSRRHDPGETSFRRSRSLATCVASDVAAKPVISRCPSARRTNRIPLTAAGTSTSEKNSCRKTEVPARGRKGGGGYVNETLENPLVSLECFIFI